MASKPTKKHPGFKSVEQGIADRLQARDPKLSGTAATKEAAAELAAATRRAGKAARARNKRLNRVRTSSK